MTSQHLITLINQLHDHFALQGIDPEKELLYRHLRETLNNHQSGTLV